MTEWKEYAGSDEQIADMRNAKHGFVFKYKFKTGHIEQSQIYTVLWDSMLQTVTASYITHYLICNPHPLADMICQQASTGQEVWIKVIVHKLDFHQHNLIEFFRFVDKGMTWERNYSDNSIVFKTTKPVFGIPGAQYSFTEFKD